LPENSIPAFLRALELGAEAIELDVHATVDGTVVVHHDASLSIVSGSTTPTRAIAGMPDREESGPSIAGLSATDLHNYPLSNGIPIPTLNDALEAIGTRAMVYVEIKAPNIELLVARCIRESTASCAVHSFDHRIARNVKRIFPAIRTGVLEVARHVDPVAPLVATGAQDLWQHVDYIDEDLVAQAHSRDRAVIAWTANDPAQWETLRALGVDGICTDRIGELTAFNW
jgi:glycerophosphoryl diester phosphodiesterase